jgi:hypothetical protein
MEGRPSVGFRKFSSKKPRHRESAAQPARRARRGWTRRWPATCAEDARSDAQRPRSRRRHRPCVRLRCARSLSHLPRGQPGSRRLSCLRRGRDATGTATSQSVDSALTIKGGERLAAKSNHVTGALCMQRWNARVATRRAALA